MEMLLGKNIWQHYIYQVEEIYVYIVLWEEDDTK